MLLAVVRCAMTLPLPHWRQRKRLTNWATRRPGLDPEAGKITLGDDAAMPAAQAAHRDHPALRFPVRTRGHSQTPTQTKASLRIERIWAVISGNQPEAMTIEEPC
jgi:hypothetical protein